MICAPCDCFKSAGAYQVSADLFREMYESQVDFMKLLQEKRGFPEFPVDLTSKNGQQLLRKITHDAQDELSEANTLLKNSKSHRITEVKDIDRASYVEELVDAQKFLLEILIAAGISLEEFIAAFRSKTVENNERIKNDY